MAGFDITLPQQQGYVIFYKPKPTVEMVSQAVVRTTNLSTGEQRVFDYDRIKQAFDYYAGNVKGDIMEYFDWEYVRFLLLEELE